MHTPNYVDSSACSIVDGLLSLGHVVYNTRGQLNYGEAYDGRSLYDLYLMADTDDVIMARELSGKKRPRVVIHAHDRWTDYLYAPDSPIKPVPNIECDLMFVRDLDETVWGKRSYPVISLDYAIERRYMEACDKFRDLPRENKMVFYGTLTTARRNFYLDKVRNAGLSVQYGKYKFNQPDDKWSQWIHGRYTHDENYYKALCQSMFAFAPLGAGSSCFRHMEAYAAGCIPVIQQYPEDIVGLWKFEDEFNCIMWKNEYELISKLVHYMNHPEEAEQLRQQCFDYGQEHLLSKHLAEYMLENIEEVKFWNYR